MPEGLTAAISIVKNAFMDLVKTWPAMVLAGFLVIGGWQARSALGLAADEAASFPTRVDRLEKDTAVVQRLVVTVDGLIQESERAREDRSVMLEVAGYSACMITQLVHAAEMGPPRGCTVNMSPRALAIIRGGT